MGQQTISLKIPIELVERIDALQVGLQMAQRDRVVDRSELLAWILSRGISAIEKEQEALL